MPSNEALIPGFIRQSIIDAFRVQATLDVTIAAAVTVKSSEPAGPVDCLSVIGIKSSDLQGSLSLWFPKTTFLALLERMLGEKFTEITHENVDACGEFLNIIYASARLNINQSGFDFQPAIPTTVSGKELNVMSGAGAHVLRFTCESEAGPFTVGLSLQKVASSLSKAG